MTRPKQRILILFAAVGLRAPAAFSDVVFDPTNFAKAVEQVAQETQLVAQFKLQIQNQLKMLENWHYSELAGILRDMALRGRVFDQAGETYLSTDPGATLDERYPADPGSYGGISDAQIEAMGNGWNRQARNVLIENRTVQNDAYRSLAATAQRVERYVERSNAAPGATAAIQAGNEELATVVAQLQTLQAQEITDARGETERAALAQAEDAYGEQQRRAVRGDWDNPPAPTGALTAAFPLADE